MGPTWGQTGSCWPHEPCYQGCYPQIFLSHMWNVITSTVPAHDLPPIGSMTSANTVLKNFGPIYMQNWQLKMHNQIPIKALSELSHKCVGFCWSLYSQITKFMGLTWGPPGSCRPQMGPMLAPWTLLSGLICLGDVWYHCLNPLHATLFIGNTKMYLQLISLLYNDMTQVVEILPHIRQELTYST